MNKGLSIGGTGISKIVIFLEKDVLLEGDETAESGYVYTAQRGSAFWEICVPVFRCGYDLGLRRYLGGYPE